VISQRTQTAAAVIGLALAFSLRTGAASPALDRAFAEFWRAGSPLEAAKATEAIAKSGASFDEALALLKAGRPYDPNAPRGIVQLTHRLGETDFPYVLDVPPTYNPANRYQVRVQLHGGVGRPEVVPRGNGIGALAGAEQIYVLPTAWAEAEWWTDLQLENLRAILDRVKRTYNVDENRVVLSGVSDGGTAAYYVAMRETTPFAAFLPLNGAIVVLRNTSMRIDGELFPNNFVNKPFFIVNGGRDQLYPASRVVPYIDQMKKGGVTLTYLPQPQAGHNTAWWPEVKAAYESFVSEHPRNPLPQRITWESDLSAGTNRAHWLVIDTLAARPRKDAPRLPDVNDFITSYDFMVGSMFAHRAPSGRVDLGREGNTVTATTRGVQQFTLLLSPDMFDFTRPVTVVADGRTVFNGRVTKSVATLLKWAARDNDRTMLFGAEVKVRIP
jgi:predicted esterase